MGGCIDNFSHFFNWDCPNRHDLYRERVEIHEQGRFFDDLMVEEASRFMEQHRARPFFIYFAVNMPHYPYQGEPKWLERFTDLPYPRNLYAACHDCSPTRASILTGKSPARLHLTDWLPGRGDRPNQKLKRPVIVQRLSLEEVTLAEALKEGGYRTGFIGKWHLGGTNFFPENQGFDLNIGGCAPYSATTRYYSVGAHFGAPRWSLVAAPTQVCQPKSSRKVMAC